jgi:hypothetical protein
VTTCRHYAAQVLLGRIALDDVPEAQQMSVQWLVRRCGPDTETTDPVAVIEGMMRKIERLRRETK